MSEADRTFHYSWLMPPKQPICFEIREETLTCECGVTFTRLSKTKTRCAECQARVTEKRKAAYKLKFNAKRKAERQAQKQSKGL